VLGVAADDLDIDFGDVVVLVVKTPCTGQPERRMIDAATHCVVQVLS
jgi:hypothetical protein